MNAFSKWLATNWLTIATLIVTAGVAYGVHSVNVKWIDQRIAQLEAVKADQLRWTVEQHERMLAKLDGQQDSTRNEISDLKSKVDRIVVILERVEKKIDGQPRP